jgi:hypothetical protein
LETFPTVPVEEDIAGLGRWAATEGSEQQVHPLVSIRKIGLHP